MIETTRTLDETDRVLLEEIQQQFPVDHRPFQTLGEKLGISEQACLERINRLKTRKVIRQVSAVFDAATLGYHATVAAMQVDPSRADEAAGVITQHPGVSHLYKLNDPFNVWFTLHVPPTDSLEQVLTILQTLAKADETIVLPTLRLYKTGPVHDQRHEASWLEYEEEIFDERHRLAPKVALTERDIRFVRVVQEDLPLLEIPYAVWAEQAEGTEEELFAWLKRMEHLGAMRRLAALLYPSDRSLLANAIVVWQVPTEQLDTVGDAMAQFREVRYCYQRPVYPSWPYALFTVIHAATYAECMDATRRLEDRIGRFPHKHLFSTKEYKRIRVKYFNPQLDAWWQEVGLPAAPKRD